MMEKYFYSATENTWHPLSMRDDYIRAGTWPDDAKEYPYEVFESTVLRRPQGKVMRPNSQGIPTLFEMPKAVVTPQALKDAVTLNRWSIETSGVTLSSGVRVSTGIDDQNRITSVVANAERSGLAEFDFKAESGWERVTLAELQGIAVAIAQHVQACFSTERSHHEAIDALANAHAHDDEALQTALNAYDISKGWPATDLREPQAA